MDCDLRFAELVGMHWVPDGPENLEACCAKKHGNNSVAYNFCLMVCSLCCKKLILTFKCPDPTSTKKPKSNGGPRDYPPTTPTDNGISFSTSAYGAPLPIVYGSDKLTGNVFWASPVRKVIIDAESFYQTMDFAFGLCEGEINGVLRMWIGEKLIFDNTVDTDPSGVIQPDADGFIAGRRIDLTDPEGPLRNVAADKRQTTISVFTGSEGQLPEGIMVTRDGFDNVPAYRGVAYVLFENFIVADTQVPNIFVEVTSNTTNNFPRLYGSQVATPSVFDEPTGELCIVDVSYDQTYIASRKTTGTPQPRGFTVFENNDHENLSESEVRVAESAILNYPVTRLLPLTGYLMTSQDSGNAGILRVWNPFAKAFVDELGPGGGIAGHNVLTGMSSLERGSIAFVGLDPIQGEPMDVYMGWGTSNSSIAFATVNSSGLINVVSTLNGVLPETDGRAVHYPTDDEFVEDHPTFVDDVSTEGTHILLVVGAGQEPAQLSVCRITINSDTADLANPEYVLMGTIDCDELLGRGFGHDVALVLVDPSDSNLVVFITTSAPYGSMVFKYNPFDGTIAWKTQATNFSAGQGSDQAYLVGSEYAWVAADGNGFFKLNMKTGVVTELAATAVSQDLPVPAGAAQFFNGAENTITYTTTSAAKHVTKVYLERIARSTIELSDIVKNLLERVGLLLTDMHIADLAALTLNGYTIGRRQSLRTSFAELGQAFKYDVIESNGKIKYKTRGEASIETIPSSYLGDVENMSWLRAEDQNDISRYRKINLTYRDIGREYRDNVQSLILPPYGSQSFDNDAGIDVRVPIVLDANTAKKLAEILLYAKLTYDTTYKFTLPPRYLHLDPGDVITISHDDETIMMRLRKVSIGADRSLMVEASYEDVDIYNDQVNIFGDVGQYADTVFPPVPPRVDILLLDVPYLSFDDAAETANTLLMHCIYLNVKPNASLQSDTTVYIDGDTKGYKLTKPSNFPTWGYVLTPPTATSSRFGTDNVSEVVVRVVSDDGHAFASVTHDDLLANDHVNLCYTSNGELFQFQTAVNNGDGTYTLTGLIRSKYGTEGAVNSGNKGDKFVLLGSSAGVLDTGAIRIVEIPSDNPLHVAQFFLRSSNPLQPAPVEIFYAKNLAAWAVGDMKVSWSGNDATVSWHRRTRYNGEWEDDGDETLDINEIDESYVVYFYTSPTTFKASVPDSYLRKVELSATTEYTYSEADQIADGYDGTTTDLYVTVYQNGGVAGNRYGMPRTEILASR